MIAFSAEDVLLADADTGGLVAAEIADSSEGVALTRLATVGVRRVQIPKARLALVAPSTADILGGKAIFMKWLCRRFGRDEKSRRFINR